MMNETITIREQIIEDLSAKFIDNNYVNAYWLEGADGLGRVDEYSDIDIWFDANDGYEQTVMDLCREVFEDIGELDLVEVYNHPNPKIIQSVFHIRGTSEYLLLDVCIQSRSRGRATSTFVRDDIAELPLILFDKIAIIRYIDEPKLNIEKLQQVYDEQAGIFAQRGRVTKYIKREKYLESVAYYHKYVCDPIVALARVVETPRHTDYGLVHITDHLSKQLLKDIEILHTISDLEDIGNNLEIADRVYKGLIMGIKFKYDDIVV